jgi:hypothetical protein
MANGMGGKHSKDVDFDCATNDARGAKGQVGLGETSVYWNDYRGPFGGAAGGPQINDYRAVGMSDGSVMRVTTDRKVD